MKAKEFMDAVGGVGDDYIAKYAELPVKAAERKRSAGRVPKRARAAIAACLVLIIGLGVGGYAYAEAKEYKEAVMFFEENGLSTDGLTRAEIKAVYRDITTESFTYGKTAEVIAHNSEAKHIPGWEMALNFETLDSKTVKELWEAYDRRVNSEGIRYYNSVMYVHHDEGDGWNEEVGSYIEKYDGTELVWRTELEGLYVEKRIVCADGLFVQCIGFDSNYNSHIRLIKLDGDGKALWNVSYGETSEHVSSVLSEEDGSFTLFSHPAHGGTGYVFGRVGGDGRLISRKRVELDRKLVNCAAHFNGGYLAKLFDYKNNGQASFVMIDREGDITDSFAYSSEDEYWFTRDMIEYEGRIYLSVLAMPKEGTYVIPEEPNYVNERHCMQPALDHAFENWQHDEGSFAGAEVDGLTDKIRERVRAILLVIGPEGGEPTEFYSVPGCTAKELSIGENGELVWKVGNIIGSYFSPATSAFSLQATGKVVICRFGADGGLIGRTETDEIVVELW